LFSKANEIDTIHYLMDSRVTLIGLGFVVSLGFFVVSPGTVSVYTVLTSDDTCALGLVKAKAINDNTSAAAENKTFIVFFFRVNKK